MAYQGIFRASNPNKYRGDASNIIYRSRWELLVMDRFDKDPNVIWWNSEETVIPYRSPVDGRMHRYFVDFTAHLKQVDGSQKTVLIEVKPAAQTKPPAIDPSKKKNKRYITEVLTWGVNDAKWKAAREYCKNRGYDFIILTEKELNIKF